MGVVWTIFLSSSFFSVLSPSLGNGPIKTEILSQRAVKPNITNQPNPVMSGMRTPVYSCYHVCSTLLDKNVSPSIDSDLSSHSTIVVV